MKYKVEALKANLIFDRARMSLLNRYDEICEAGKLFESENQKRVVDEFDIKFSAWKTYREHVAEYDKACIDWFRLPFWKRCDWSPLYVTKPREPRYVFYPGSIDHINFLGDSNEQIDKLIDRINRFLKVTSIVTELEMQTTIIEWLFDVENGIFEDNIADFISVPSKASLGIMIGGMVS